MSLTVPLGGERKRVTLAEALATDASVYCWDNATRGLDASTALKYAQTCRDLCDTEGKVNIVSLYQAGNGIYELFDKVTVLAEGQVIYYGPRSEARPYFEGLGLVHMDGANTADYLTAVTAMAERKIEPGFESTVPRSATAFAEIYRSSDVAKRMRQEVDNHLADQAALEEATSRTMTANNGRKNKGVSKNSSQTTSFMTQLKAALIREYQQRWADKWYVAFITTEHCTGLTDLGHSGCVSFRPFCWLG